MSYRTLSVVVPVYNEAATVAHVLHSIVEANTLGLKKEVIVVNDGSTDQTRQKIVEWLQAFNDNLKSGVRTINPCQIRVIHLAKNIGKSAAVKRGLLASTGEIVLIQDADLEYSPEDYKHLLQPFFEQQADVVYGSRFISSQPHRVLYFWHYVANFSLTLLSNIFTNLNLTDMETGFKVFRGDLVRMVAPRLVSKRFGFEPEITARMAKLPHVAFYEVGICYRGRRYEEGKKITWFDGVRAVWEIIYFNVFTTY